MIIFFILLGVFAYFHSIYLNRISLKRFNKFYSSNIEGIISCEVDGSIAGEFFCVNEEEFCFLPYTSEINNNSIFDYTAKIGDSVYKPAFCDTLLLIKPDHTYKYTFEKLK